MPDMLTSRQLQKLWVLPLAVGLVAIALLAPRAGEAAGVGATASAAKTVTVKSFAFKPATLTVKRGARVTFANTSTATHTASGTGFDTKRIAPGKSASVQLNKRGTFAYHCKIHPFMKGKVIVE
jgi:plastocyanin